MDDDEFTTDNLLVKVTERHTGWFVLDIGEQVDVLAELAAVQREKSELFEKFVAISNAYTDLSRRMAERDASMIRAIRAR